MTSSIETVVMYFNGILYNIIVNDIKSVVITINVIIIDSSISIPFQRCGTHVK
jgi:hypothetical protein